MHWKVFEIRERCLNFAAAVSDFSLQLKKYHYCEITGQIIRSSISTSTNLAEVHSSQSKKEFIRIANIALREISKTSYSFDLIGKLHNLSSHQLPKLKQESVELYKIVTTTIMNTKENVKKKKQ